ncbi:hypothetical protein, partial [Microvirga zambiensis]|uniref:hypothetical protein n=1 Tax=Microvirga zambiensis TaxID=1402137 RepID=UPI001AEF5817
DVGARDKPGHDGAGVIPGPVTASVAPLGSRSPALIPGTSPGMTMGKSIALHRTGMAGTRPAMT